LAPCNSTPSEAGLLGVLRCAPEFIDNPGNLMRLQRARRRYLHLAVHRERLALRRDCRGRDRQLADVEIRMRHAPDMPELREDQSAGAMHRAGHRTPPGDLLVRVDAGRADVTDALRAHLRRLGDHKAGTGALRIIGGGERMSDVAIDAAAAGHWRQDEAVLQLEVAEAVGCKQRVRLRWRGAEILRSKGSGHDISWAGGT